MEKKPKAFFLFVLLLFISAAVMYYFSGKILPNDNIETEAGSQAVYNKEKPEPVDMDALSSEYEEEALNIVKNYEAMSRANHDAIDDMSIEKLKNWKELMLSRKVPSKYKEFHLSLVLLLSDPRQLESGQGLEKIQTAKNTYDWLN
jgi:hypothetical protein